jgi:hypothetical protein
MKGECSTNVDHNTGKVDACRCHKRRNDYLSESNYQIQNFGKLFKRRTFLAMLGGILALVIAAIFALDICSKLRN